MRRAANSLGGNQRAVQLREMYRERKAQIQRRLEDFRRVQVSEYFYELIYCLLTPQSSAVNAAKVVEGLQRLRFQEKGENPESLLRNPAHYIRFHRTKSRHLLLVREVFPAIAEMLLQNSPANEKREWLVQRVKGLGYKEATHFLRNIGKNGGLAILDRHILRNLQRHGVIRSIPETISKKHYFRIEKRMQEFARQIRIPLDELDLLFWSRETGEIRK